MSRDHAADLRERFVGELVSGGFLHSPLWVKAFRDVPRDEFLPRFFRPTETGMWEAIDEGHPERLDLVYTNVTWVTQLDGDGSRWQAASSNPVVGEPTSSSTLPGLMAQMLEALQVHEGDSVLEIGTGTGYNAALLCHRLGSAPVTTVEVEGTLHALPTPPPFGRVVLVLSGEAGMLGEEDWLAAGPARPLSGDGTPL